MLIFGNETYLIGGCLSAFVHKKIIEKLNLNIKIVVMVDNLIYKYKKELLFFFDEIFLINLIEIKLGVKYLINERYSKWIKYSVNKWQLLKLDQFNKILFIDVDVLPIDDKFYELFNFNTPALFTNGNQNLNNIKISQNYIFFKDNFNIKDVCSTNIRLKKSIDGSLALFTPNKNLYNDYIDFLKYCDDKGGWNAFPYGGVDETSILLFLLIYKKMNIYHISNKYLVKPKKFINNYALNYVSSIKPWTKLPIIQWPDENIWHEIVKKAFINQPLLTNLYLKLLIKELIEFIDNYDYLINNNKFYENNIECVTNPKIKDKTFKLINYINKNKNKLLQENDNINNNEIKKIIKYSKYIHSFMLKDIKFKKIFNDLLIKYLD